MDCIEQKTRSTGERSTNAAAGRRMPEMRAVARAPRALVTLVGAGPGDPDLLTLRALRALRNADAVVYDHLVSTQVLDCVRADAQRIYVGKERGNHTLPQDEINQLLVQLASEGKRVVRLKGGDPFVFGRGGEEMQMLAQHGIRCEVVPGVTAACGIAASTGVPLTHRDHAQACIFVTGHLRDGTMDLDWEALVRPRQTVVVYMGLKGLDVLARELVRRGLSAATPVMVVEKGTMPQEKVVVGVLADIAERAAAARLSSPALTIIGDVVRCREQVAQWQRHAIEASAAAV